MVGAGRDQRLLASRRMADLIPWVIGAGALVVVLLVLLPLLARGGRARTERSRVSGWRSRAGAAVATGAEALDRARAGDGEADERLKALTAELHALAATPPDPECAGAVTELVASARGLRTALSSDGDTGSAIGAFESSLERLRSLT